MAANASQLKMPVPTAREGARGEKYPRLRIAVLAIWLLFLAYCLYRLTEEPFAAVAGAMLIATAALLPAYLWTGGLVPGMPILPLHTTAFLWTHALPLVVGYAEVGSYEPDEFLLVSVCVALYCFVATVAWIAVATRSVKLPASYRVLTRDRGFTFFIVAIAFGAWLISAMIDGWIVIVIEPGLFGILRSTILSFASIGMFVLSLRLARGDLHPLQSVAFLAAAACFVAAQVTTLFLVGAIVSTASALIGYTIGGGKVPWAAILASLLVFGFLHGGKGEMRERYWAEEAPLLTLDTLPTFYSDWIDAGTRELTTSDRAFGSLPIYERVSLMHLLLLVQRASPDIVPYLEGASYTFLPQLLVPRIIDPDKPQSHFGTALLNVRYGIQSEEDTETTTVAWGLLNEAYANFALLGVAGLAVLIGCLFGFAGRLTVGAPVMSLQSMVGVTIAALAIQSEFTMGVFVTVLSQSLVVLLLVMPFLDKRRAGEAD